MFCQDKVYNPPNTQGYFVDPVPEKLKVSVINLLICFQRALYDQGIILNENIQNTCFRACEGPHAQIWLFGPRPPKFKYF